MALIALPYTFSPNTVIASAQVNADFSSIVAVVNGQLGTSNISPTEGIDVSLIKNAAQTLAGKGSVTLPGGLILCWNTVMGVAWDGSATFSDTLLVPFTNACFGSIIIPVNPNYLATPAALGANLVSLTTATGVTTLVAVCFGAAVGSTGAAFYLALGY